MTIGYSSFTKGAAGRGLKLSKKARESKTTFFFLHATLYQKEKKRIFLIKSFNLKN
jgi:hypothetical protein